MAPAASPSPKAIPSVPVCLETEVRLDTALDSASAKPGDPFVFTVTDRIPAHDGTPAIPAGSRGYGIVALVSHAASQGQGGYIELEPRYIELKGGGHVEVMADPQAPLIVTGSGRSAPWALEWIPVAGLAFSGYNSFHHGKEARVGAGSLLTIVIGDALARSACYVPPRPK